MSIVTSFEIVCSFQGGRKEAVGFYIGLPDFEHHPIHFQSKWLSSEKGGSVPDDVMKSLKDLYNTAKANNLNFPDLCSFALQSATKNQKTVNKGGNGFASARAGEEIDKYAKEFLEKNGISVGEGVKAQEVASTDKEVKIDLKNSEDSVIQSSVDSNQSKKSLVEDKLQKKEDLSSDSNNSTSSDVYGDDSDLL